MKMSESYIVLWLDLAGIDPLLVFETDRGTKLCCPGGSPPKLVLTPQIPFLLVALPVVQFYNLIAAV